MTSLDRALVAVISAGAAWVAPHVASLRAAGTARRFSSCARARSTDAAPTSTSATTMAS